GAGDVDGDGYDDMAVGASAYDDTLTDEGAVFLYSGSASGVSATPSWTRARGQASAELGTAVAAAGDTNGDGYDDLLGGAPGYDDGESDEGEAWIYAGSASGPGTTAQWSRDADVAGSHLGSSVAAAGDVDGDGHADVLVGAPEFPWPYVTTSTSYGNYGVA